MQAIAPKLEEAEIARARRNPTESLDAYDNLLRGLAVGTRCATKSPISSRRTSTGLCGGRGNVPGVEARFSARPHPRFRSSASDVKPCVLAHRAYLPFRQTYVRLRTRALRHGRVFDANLSQIESASTQPETPTLSVSIRALPKPVMGCTLAISQWTLPMAQETRPMTQEARLMATTPSLSKDL